MSEVVNLEDKRKAKDILADFLEAKEEKKKFDLEAAISKAGLNEKDAKDVRRSIRALKNLCLLREMIHRKEDKE